MDSSSSRDRSILKKLSPCIVEAKLRSSESLAIDLKRFYELVSPRYENFHNLLQSGLRSGKGLDVSLTEGYEEFNRIIESHIAIILENAHINQTDFVEAISTSLDQNDPIATSLLKLAYSDSHDTMITFCEMMEEKFQSIYKDCESSGINGRQYDIEVALQKSNRDVDRQATISSMSHSNRNIWNHVRVLWDIENIPVTKRHGTLATIDKLHKFLEIEGLYGINVDTRITVFYNPDKSNVSKKVIKDLDKFNVEIVWISKKREDADRKIGQRIIQDMNVLSPSNSSFVIISSDADFRHDIEMLVQKGYSAYIIHNAKNLSTQSLDMFATKSFRWEDITNLDEDKGICSKKRRKKRKGKIDPSCDSDNFPTISSNESVSDAIQSRLQKVEINEQLEYIDSASTDIDQPFKIIGWVTATCIRWKGCYGFLAVEKSDILRLVDSSPSLRQDVVSYLYSLKNIIAPSSECDTTNMNINGPKYSSAFSGLNFVRVYCHHSCLQSPDITDHKKSQLTRGENITCEVMLGSRGLRAHQVVRNAEIS